MHETLQAFVKWLDNTPWGVAVRGSSWMYPILEWVHLSGLSVGLGSSVVVDLRLMGVGRRRMSATQLSDGLFAWNWIGFCVAFLAGFLLFSADATTYVSNTGFCVKLGVLTPLALIWHVVVQKKTPAWTHAEEKSAIGKWAGLVEALLWISVISASVYFLLTNAVTHP